MYLILEDQKYDLIELTGEEHLSSPFKFLAAINPPADFDDKKIIYYPAEIDLSGTHFLFSKVAWKYIWCGLAMIFVFQT